MASSRKMDWTKELQNNAFITAAPRQKAKLGTTAVDRWTTHRHVPTKKKKFYKKRKQWNISPEDCVNRVMEEFQRKQKYFKENTTLKDNIQPKIPDSLPSIVPTLPADVEDIASGVSLVSLLEARECDPLLPMLPVTLCDFLGSLNVSLRVNGQIRADEVITKVLLQHRSPYQRLPQYYYEIYQVYSPDCVRRLEAKEVIQNTQVTGMTATTYFIHCLNYHYQAEEDSNLLYCREVLEAVPDLQRFRYVQVKRDRMRTLRIKIDTKEAMIRFLELMEVGKVEWDGWSVDKMVDTLVRLRFPSNPQAQAFIADNLHEREKERYDDARGGWDAVNHPNIDWYSSEFITEPPPPPTIIRRKLTPYLANTDFGLLRRHWYPDYEYLLGLYHYCHTHSNTTDTLASLRLELPPLKDKLEDLQDIPPLRLFQEDLTNLWDTLVEEDEVEEAIRLQYKNQAESLQKLQTELGATQLSSLAWAASLQQVQEKVEGAYDTHRIILHTSIVQAEKGRAVKEWITTKRYNHLKEEAETKLKQCVVRMQKDLYRMKHMKVDNWLWQANELGNNDVSDRIKGLEFDSMDVHDPLKTGEPINDKREQMDNKPDNIHNQSLFVELVHCVAQMELQSYQSVRRVLRSELQKKPPKHINKVPTTKHASMYDKNFLVDMNDTIHNEIFECELAGNTSEVKKINKNDNVNKRDGVHESDDEKDETDNPNEKQKGVDAYDEVDSDDDVDKDIDKSKEPNTKRSKEKDSRLQQKLEHIIQRNKFHDQDQSLHDDDSWAKEKWEIPKKQQRGKKRKRARSTEKDTNRRCDVFEGDEQSIKVTNEMLNDKEAIMKYYHSLLELKLNKIKKELQEYYTRVQKEQSELWSDTAKVAKLIMEEIPEKFYPHDLYDTKTGKVHNKIKMMAERLISLDKKLKYQQRTLSKCYEVMQK